MKLRIAALSLLILCFALDTAASVGPLFMSGPINGNLNGFFIDGPGGPFGQSISDQFVTTAGGFATNLNFGEWTLGGTPTVVSWALGTSSFGSDIASGDGAATSTFLGTNSFGYGIYDTQISIFGELAAGNTYYLTLSGANDAGGSQFDAWDDNESPTASCYFEIRTAAADARRPNRNRLRSSPKERRRARRPLSLAVSCCSVLVSSAWLAYCAAGCLARPNPTASTCLVESRSLKLRLFSSASLSDSCERHI